MAADCGRDCADHGTGIGSEALTTLRLRLRALLHRRQLDRDLEDELAFHLAMRQEQSEMDAPAARRQFGNVTSVKEACREMWTLGWLEAFWQDVRYGCRQLRTDRGFAIVTALTLSLGIGATSSIYSLYDLVSNSMILPHPETLAAVLQASPSNPHSWSSSSAADVEDIRQNQSTLTDLASWQFATSNMIDPGGEAMRVEQVRVTANFFDVVGISPALGRGFLPGEDQPGHERIAIMTDRFWRARFHGDPGAVGRILRLDNQDYLIVGIMPPKFYFPRPAAVLWTPLALTPEQRAARGPGRLESMGRLKPGRTLRQAQAELNGLASRLEKLYPQTNTGRRFLAWPLRRYFPGDLVAQFVALMLGAALFVLLIACVNVANLQFARGTARWREMAVRQALGASRWRTVAQLVTESIILSTAGAALGIVLARFGTDAIRGSVPAELRRFSPMWDDFGLNLRVLMFALTAGVLSGIVAGLAPALRSSRLNLTESLKEGGHGSSPGSGRLRLRSVLLVAETAMTVVLLVGAGLTIHGFQNLAGVKSPIDPSTLLTLRLDVTDSSRRPDQLTEFYRQAMDGISSLPGVRGVTAASYLPFNLRARYGAFWIQGRTPQPAKQPNAQIQVTGPDYFRTMHIPLRSGRLLDGRDGPRTAPAAVISEEMARRWWPGEPVPIGQQVRLGTNDAPWITIVGVVGDIQAFVLETAPRPTLYLSYTQFPERGMDIAIRATKDPLALAGAARAAIRAIDPGQPVTDVQTLEKMRINQAVGVAFMASLLGTFGTVALLLSCVGIYGMTAYLVAQQQHEIGIRMALGAGAGSVLRLFLMRGSRAALAGLALGLPCAFGLARLMAAVIWGVTARDVQTFAAAPLLLIVAAGLAIYIPARRAVRIDPVVALRSE